MHVGRDRSFLKPLAVLKSFPIRTKVVILMNKFLQKKLLVRKIAEGGKLLLLRGAHVELRENYFSSEFIYKLHTKVVT